MTVQVLKHSPMRVLKHVPFEGPDSISVWAKEKGLSLKCTNLYDGPAFPAADSFDSLVIMGGPMGVYEQQKYPWLEGELALIREAIRSGKKVLGICLGAQLIAGALGARVYPHTQKEIGWYEVEKVNGGRDPLFAEFPERFVAFHWHGDTFDLPKGAAPLFRSKACENQGYRVGENVLGLQFHPEVTGNGVRLMAENLASHFKPEGETGEAFRFVQTQAEILGGSTHCARIGPLFFKTLDLFFQTV